MRVFLLVILSCSLAFAIAEDKPLEEQSTEELKTTIRSSPGSLTAYLYLAKSYLGFGERTAADSENEVNQGLETSGAFYEDALKRLDKGEQQAAIIQLNNAIKADENNLSAYILLAETYHEMKFHEAAAINLRAALAHGADPNLALIPFGESLLAGGQFDEVLSELTLSGFSPDLRAKVRVMHGRAYLGLRQYERAEKLLMEALQSDESLVTAHVELARLAVFRSNSEDARTQLDQIAVAGEYIADYWLLKGELERINHKPEQAIDFFKQALRLEEDHLLALQAIANEYLNLGNLGAAETSIEKIRKVYPTDLRGLLLELMLLTQQQKTDRMADVILDAKLIIDQLDYGKLQQDPYGLILVGSIHHLSGRMPEAASALEQYLEFVPDDLFAIKLLVTAHLEQQQPAAAARLLNRAAKHFSDHPDYWILSAETSIQQKKYAEALPYLDKVIEVQPMNKQARLNRAKVNASLGNHDSAIEELQFMRRSSSDLSLNLTLGEFLLAMGRSEQALELASETETRFGKSVKSEIFRGKAYLNLGNVDLARQAFNSALAKDQKSTAAAYNIAVLDVASGDLAAATNRFKSILSIDNAHRPSLLQLSALADRAGNQRDTIGYLKDALKIRSDVDNHVHLVNLLIASKRGQEARDALTTLRLQHPEDLKVMAADAKWNTVNDNKDRARQIYVIMREQAVRSASVRDLVSIARLQLALDDKVNAFITLDAAQTLDKDNLTILVARAEFKAYEEKYEDALTLARELVNRAPGLSVGYRLMGDNYNNLNRPQEALDSYKRGTDLPTADVDLILSYYTSLRSLQGAEAALAFLEDHVSQKKSVSYQILRVVAAGYADVGAHGKAIALNETLMKGQPNDPILLNNLAILYLKTQDKRARTLAQKAYELAPDNYAVMDTLGWILVNEGDAAVAIAILRNAMARSANVPEIKYHYAVALHRNGQSSTALKELRAILAEGRTFDGIDDARALYESLL